ncbi:MAG TPA: histidine--tRNA ligase [bacterium]|nr:histidine--tRNA ligase [bacterium]
MNKIAGVKGMEDLIDPGEAKKWQWIEAMARRVFAPAGFREIRTPILEEADLFDRGVGVATEIVEKEMYTLLDRNEKRLAMRPEGTAPVVRAFIEHFTSHNVQEGRFLYMGPMFRYERPQKGRLRQFHQIGAEVFGADHPLLDAELIALSHQLFAELGLSSLQLSLNSLGTPEDREKYRQALSGFLDGIKGSLCEECQRRIVRNPLRALDCKKPGCIEATSKAPAIAEFYSPEAAEHFNGVQAGLRAFGVPFLINPRLVRGLDYYEKTVFEFLSADLGAQNSVAGGGRYNGLVEELGGPKVPAIGFALGMERLVAILPPNAAFGGEPPRIYLLATDPESEQILFPSLKALRETGAVVEMDFGSSSLKSKMRRADRWKADWVAIFGEEERRRNVVILRDMKGQDQEEVPLDEIFMRLLARFPTQHHP